MLSLEEVTVHYGRTPALRGISLRVGDGEIVALIGANGAGKTTLLNAVTGVVPLHAGRILWDGQPLQVGGDMGRSLPTHRLVDLGVAYVPEGRQLFPAMSVLDNLLLGCYHHCARRWVDLLGPLGRFRASASVQGSLERVYGLFPVLKERQGQRAGSLSGGEQQMLAIGRALMASPRLLLLDEPSIGLAPTLVREIMALLRRLREEGLTILLVEQDAVAALRTADRGYVMERGRIAVEGEAHDLLVDEKVRHAYLGKAPIERNL
ncbi:MAG: ABC transporter ATP-binding protein [Bacteroidetes bacterium]|nr:ABC transporter ATP-binding protein [Bacteroidota bacterium]